MKTRDEDSNNWDSEPDYASDIIQAMADEEQNGLCANVTECGNTHDWRSHPSGVRLTARNNQPKRGNT